MCKTGELLVSFQRLHWDLDHLLLWAFEKEDFGLFFCFLWTLYIKCIHEGKLKDQKKEDE